MNEILKVNNLSKKFNTINGEIEAIKDISLTINEGEFVALVGPSGCGKSTLLSIIAGLEKESSGNIDYSIDKPVIGYMLQEDALFEHLKIKDNILLGLKIQKKLNDENIKYANNLLKKYGLEDFKDKRPSELSGGMKQRVA
jgi:NitT/TauT family transport system ATP-binding protein